jgi:serine/threonine protein kinase
MAERFELLEQVGRGAMGVVWKARDNERGKIVAIKMLRDLHVDDPEYVQRFAREVDLASSVRSPHVVRVRGYGGRKDGPYLVLEFVAGRSLRAHIIDDGPFPPAEARDLLAQVAEALAAVHAVGIVHRDVKASNVLLTEDGVAKLTDFGIARDSGTKGPTRIGSLVGTPAYMAPEGPVDARSDLYSLGVLYYELLTGALPFPSTNYQEVILAHVNTAPDLTQLPPSERQLTGWLMAKSPAARPGSAVALLATLRATGMSLEPPADPTSTPNQYTSERPVTRPSMTRRGAWTPTPTPMRTPARTPGYARTPTQQRQHANRANPNAGAALLLVILGALVMLGAIVFLATGPGGGSAATAAATAAPASSSQTGSGAGSMVPIAALFLAVGGVAVAATLASSRNRRNAR